MPEELCFPDPELSTISGQTVESWPCPCGRSIGEFSALRSWEIHGAVKCGRCWKAERPVEEEE